MSSQSGQTPEAPEGWRRLEAALHLGEELEHVEPGELANFAEINASHGRLAADRQLPHVAQHLADGCEDCTADLWELRLFIRNGRDVKGREDGRQNTEAEALEIGADTTLTVTGPRSALRRRRSFTPAHLAAVAAALLVIWYATLEGQPARQTMVADPVSARATVAEKASAPVRMGTPTQPTVASTAATSNDPSAAPAAARVGLAPSSGGSSVSGRSIPASAAPATSQPAASAASRTPPRTDIAPASSPPPASAWYLVSGTQAPGRALRRSPRGAWIGLVNDGEYVLDLGEKQESAGREWRKVRATSGIEGWTESEYLVPVSAPNEPQPTMPTSP